MRILVCGLPGSGKTTFARELLLQLGANACWFNADNVRKLYDDWDFSYQGRIRQAERMKKLADDSSFEYVICDFVAPTKEIRDIFSADYTIWMNTEQKSIYIDTDRIFEKPKYNECDYIVEIKNVESTVKHAVDDILKLK